jgi:hypothetical protein
MEEILISVSGLPAIVVAASARLVGWYENAAGVGRGCSPELGLEMAH